MSSRSRKIFLVYLAVLSLTGSLIVYFATSKQGPGVSSDAAAMLSAGENLLKNRGLVDYRGNGLAQYPPLESLLLAAGSLLFHKDVFVVGWGLSVLVFALLVWFCGLYFLEAFGEELLLAYFASFIVFSSASLIQISSNIASDPLFLLLTVLALRSMSAYLRTGSMRAWGAAVLITILACFERYTGLSLVIAGTAVTLYRNRSDIKRGMLPAAAFAVLSGAPIAAWGFFHNLPLNGALFGRHQPAVPLLNLVTSLDKVVHWFIPVEVFSLVGSVFLTLFVIAALLLLLYLTHTLPSLSELLRPEAAPSLAFLPVYCGVLLFALSYSELRGINTDRVHLILLPPLLIVLFGACRGPLQVAIARFSSRPVYALAIAAFTLWSIYPLSRTYKYVTASMASGDISAYNSINKRDVLTSPLSQALKKLDLRDKAIYSNGSAQTWFILREVVSSPPRIYSEDRLGYLQAHEAHWPGAGRQAYLVWFTRENHTAADTTPEELQSISDLQLIYSDEGGTIYLVTAR